MTSRYEAITQLSAFLHRLTGRDYEFASSLISQHRERGNLSEKQWPWVETLLKKASAPKVDPIALGDFESIRNLFKSTGLKQPKLFLAVGERTIKFAVAGAGSKFPGSIGITDHNAIDSCGRNVWYGRIRLDGTFQPSALNSLPTGLLDALKAFAADPEGVAAKYGKTTGCCCFCGHSLGHGKDERSKEVGYGPECAKKFGLTWGGIDPKALPEDKPRKPRKPRSPRAVEEDIAIW